MRARYRRGSFSFSKGNEERKEEKKGEKRYWPRVIETVFTSDKSTDRLWNAKRKFAYLMGIKSIDDPSSIPFSRSSRLLYPLNRLHVCGGKGGGSEAGSYARNVRSVAPRLMAPMDQRSRRKVYFPFRVGHRIGLRSILTPISRLLYDRIMYSNRLVPCIYMYIR